MNRHLTPEWHDQALCRQIGGELFFPPEPDDTNQDWHAYRYTEARAVCTACPVRDACLDEAMAREGDIAHQYRAGMWGGMSPTERTKLARAQAGRAAA